MPVSSLPQAALGRDFAARTTDVDDLDPYFSAASGPRAAVEAVAAALSHEPGTLWWAPERGTSLRAFLHRPFDAEEIRLAVETECLKEERVADARATVEQFGGDLHVRVELTLHELASAVTLTLDVSDVATAIAVVGV